MPKKPAAKPAGGKTCGRQRTHGAPGKPPRQPPAAPPTAPDAPDPGEAGDSAYDRHRQRMADKSRQRSATGREIGPLPAIVDPARKDACREDLKRYLKTFHPHAFPLAFSEVHEEVIRRVQDAILRGGLFALAMPRGSGKTTIVAAASVWAILYGHCRFVFLIGATEEKADELLESIKLELETNELLLQDFPEVCFPLWQLEGIHNRAKGQTLDGEATRIVFKKRQIILPTVAGSPASSAIIKTGGLLGAVRGARVQRPDGSVVRPDLVILDDPQTRESAESPDQSATRIRIIAADVLGMAGPGKEITAIMPCTVICPGDAADTLLDVEKHPSWRGIRTSLLTTLPDDMELWEKYWEVFCQQLKAGTGEEIPTKATDLYRKHRRDMDAGAHATWPARHRPDELSAIQHAMNLLLRDEQAFWSEYQNQPRDPHADEDFLSAQEIAAKVTPYARGEIPQVCEVLTCGIDVQKHILFYVICGFAYDFTGYVLDYGVWPKQRRATFTARRCSPQLSDIYPNLGPDGALQSGLTELLGDILKKTWTREDGLEMALGKGLIDQGYLPHIVHRAIRQNKWVGRLVPSYGKGFTAQETPISAYKQKQGELLGEEWLLRAPQGSLRECKLDTNYWKTFVHRRLLQADGDPGALLLFGAEAPGRKADHGFFSRQLDSEKRTVVVADRKADHWEVKPNSENHWFDALVYAYVAASMLGCKTGGQFAATVPRTGRTRVNLTGRDGRSFFATDR